MTFVCSVVDSCGGPTVVACYTRAADGGAEVLIAPAPWPDSILRENGFTTCDVSTYHGYAPCP